MTNPATRSPCRLSYAGIGARRAPPGVLTDMTRIARLTSVVVLCPRKSATSFIPRAQGPLPIDYRNRIVSRFTSLEEIFHTEIAMHEGKGCRVHIGLQIRHGSEVIHLVPKGGMQLGKFIDCNLTLREISSEHLAAHLVVRHVFHEDDEPVALPFRDVGFGRSSRGRWVEL